MRLGLHDNLFLWALKNSAKTKLYKPFERKIRLFVPPPLATTLTKAIVGL